MPRPAYLQTCSISVVFPASRISFSVNWAASWSFFISLLVRLDVGTSGEGVDTKLIVVGVCCVLAALVDDAELVDDAGREVGFVDDDNSVVVVSIGTGPG